MAIEGMMDGYYGDEMECRGKCGNCDNCENAKYLKMDDDHDWYQNQL